jgi:Fur family ferric uptake transcriptional regulator
VEELYARSSARDPNISIATVYRTVKLFEESGIIDRLEFGDGRARYEDAERDHHDHLIDMHSGEVIEFVDPEIEALQEKIAQKLGYRLKGHKLELYGYRFTRSDPRPVARGPARPAEGSMFFRRCAAGNRRVAAPDCAARRRARQARADRARAWP